MFGPDVLVAPVMYEGRRSRKVYLPTGVKWKDAQTGELFDGGSEIDCAAPLDTMPVFLKDGTAMIAGVDMKV